MLILSKNAPAKTFDVDISTGRPAASNEAYYHGETIEFRAVRGRSVVTNVEYSSIYYQTNGMDSVWWHTDGLVFHPTNDVGAANYRFFLEGRDDLGRDWHANGLLRLLPSPGFTPNAIEPPVARLDFANIEVANAPYYDKAETEAKIVELAPAPDFSTSNTELVETIEATAPAPGNYAVVSNAAMNAVQIETDSTVPSWAKAANKPTYTASEVGAIPTTGGVFNASLHLNQKLSVGTWTSLVKPYDISGGSGIAFVFGDNVQTKRSNTMTLGVGALNTNEWSFIWNGDANRIYIPGFPAMSNPYATRYNGGFHVNPSVRSGMANPLQNFWIGDTNLNDWISALAPTPTWDTLSGKPTFSTVATSGAYSDLAGKPTLATVATSGSYNDLSNKPTIPTVPTEQINAATTTNALQDTAIGDLSNENAQTRQIVTTWETFLGGSNVVFSITNYISGTYSLDAAKLRVLELRDGAYQETYNSRDEILLHINDFSNRYVRVALDAIVDEVAARLASKADRNWGKYTSAGGEAPSNTVYMTAPNTVFAGGLEYERVAVGEGTICVLTTRGAPVWTQGDEGTFKFQDDGGTNYFGFAKTDSYTIGANTDGITVQGGMVTMNYNITMSGRPCVWYKSSLSSGAWEQLNLPDGSPVAGASHAVTWEANPDPGTQVCYINVGNAPSGFFKATVEVTGEAKFMTNMPADLSGGIISTNTATGVNGVVKPSFNGSSVIWTWSAD